MLWSLKVDERLRCPKKCTEVFSWERSYADVEFIYNLSESQRRNERGVTYSHMGDFWARTFIDDCILVE